MENLDKILTLRVSLILIGNHESSNENFIKFAHNKHKSVLPK